MHLLFSFCNYTEGTHYGVWTIRVAGWAYYQFSLGQCISPLTTQPIFFCSIACLRMTWFYRDTTRRGNSIDRARDRGYSYGLTLLLDLGIRKQGYGDFSLLGKSHGCGVWLVFGFVWFWSGIFPLNFAFAFALFLFFSFFLCDFPFVQVSHTGPCVSFIFLLLFPPSCLSHILLLISCLVIVACLFRLLLDFFLSDLFAANINFESSTCRSRSRSSNSFCTIYVLIERQSDFQSAFRAGITNFEVQLELVEDS